MQNRVILFFSKVMGCILFVLVFASLANAQNGDSSSVLNDFSELDLSQKKTVDFPSRSSMDSMELAPLPGLNESNINGPQSMTESISNNDFPSEKLLGRINSDVFQEMAELKRDTDFLELQLLKEKAKQDLEGAKADYRQKRLQEIAEREELVRKRIEWWQKQEQIRLEAEKKRQEEEDARSQKEKEEALKAQEEAERILAQTRKEEEQPEKATVEEAEEIIPQKVYPVYTLLSIKGTRGNLIAKVRNETSTKILTVKVGDKLDDCEVLSILSDSVVILRDDSEFSISFAE